MHGIICLKSFWTQAKGLSLIASLFFFFFFCASDMKNLIWPKQINSFIQCLFAYGSGTMRTRILISVQCDSLSIRSGGRTVSQIVSSSLSLIWCERMRVCHWGLYLAVKWEKKSSYLSLSASTFNTISDLRAQANQEKRRGMHSHVTFDDPTDESYTKNKNKNSHNQDQKRSHSTNRKKKKSPSKCEVKYWKWTAATARKSPRSVSQHSIDIVHFGIPRKTPD